MSDSKDDIAKQYYENVYKEQQPRSIGLFTIPEFPELEVERGMWSAALDAILTTLRYLAPATLLTIFWGQQSFLFRILKHIDSTFRSIVFSSEEQKQAVLQWLAEAGPVRVEHLDTVWRHGWILCGVLDAALPGACAGHPPTRLSIKHAQAIADHYLGVEPVFSRQELEENDSLSRHQEWKFATYLDRIRQVLDKLTPPVSKPVSHRTSPEATQFILDYVAKGSGLSAVQVNNKAHFKIYPTAQQSLDPGEVTILIRGPKDTYGMAVIPPILGKAQLIRQKLLGLQTKQNFTQSILPLTQGATYLRNYGKNDMNKTYYIPKTHYDIQIEIDPRRDHTKISYVVKLEGKYLVSITSRGQSIVGSPFAVTASHNIISIFERDSFHLEDGEEIDIVDVQTDRKVVLRIVDFVTEKMLLRENGTLEKISDDEAKLLMTTDKENDNCEGYDQQIIRMDYKPVNKGKFKKAARKVLAMYQVCTIFNDFIIQKQQRLRKERVENCVRPRSQQDIPDIVNSTFTEANVNSYVISEMREKFIVPESISVSLKAEKPKSLYDRPETTNIKEIDNISIKMPMGFTRLDTPDSLEIRNDSPGEQDDNASYDSVTPTSANNPFLNDMFEENYAATNHFGTFVASEYETNKSQNEETQDNSITIIIDPNLSPPNSLPGNNNPFIDTDVINLERPKTPVYKIISGEKINREGPIILNPKSELLPEDELSNEFVNPFFMHQFQNNNFDQNPMTDFIIGAPVSLPQLIRASTPEPEMKSLIITEKETPRKLKDTRKDVIGHQSKTKEINSESVYSTPLHNIIVIKDVKEDNATSPSTFHSLDSNIAESVGKSNSSSASESQFEQEQSDSDRNITPRKEMWDSAYVSIDDSNSSPDSNNNENTNHCEQLCKQKCSLRDENNIFKHEEITNMGPAEREIWRKCTELRNDAIKPPEEVKPYKLETKRSTFTPIIEENDRTTSSGTRDIISKLQICSKQGDTDTVSVAFAELNEIYQEYFPQSETSSITASDEDNMLHSVEEEYVNQTKEAGVNSASEVLDVKRHVEKLEGTISEVQANATESFSVSQSLHHEQDYLKYNKTEVEKQFGEKGSSNIVLEKKKYWDDRIREIEAKSQETTIISKKLRNSAKQLKHDSLSKRKGKQMVKNFLSVGDYSQVKNHNQNDKETSIKSLDLEREDFSMEPAKPGEKLVEKWKKYWDDKLEHEQELIQHEPQSHATNSPKNMSLTSSPQLSKFENKINIKINPNNDSIKDTNDLTNQEVPVKQELPEEVFKAFETSPKRFFGTSRKHILNKIDTFLGKPVEEETSPVDDTNLCRESGLVSSRISLFHNLSITEELPWINKKSQSLHNIYQRRESQKSITAVEDTVNAEEIAVIPETTDISVYNAEATNLNIIAATNLKTKRSRMMNNTNNKALDETVYEKPTEKNNIPEQNHCVIKPENDLNTRIKWVPNVGDLRKKSFSKSEMDIFNKIPTDTANEFDKYKSCDELPKINVKNFISLYENVSKTLPKPKSRRRVHRTSFSDSQRTLSNSTTSDAVPKHKKILEFNTSNSVSKCTTPEATTSPNLWSSKSSETVSNLSLDTRTSDSYNIETEPGDNKETTYLSLSDIELEIVECSPDITHESSPERIEPAHIEYKNRFKLAKQYFQSLEELREVKKPQKPNECELLLQKSSTESLQDVQKHKRQPKRVKKNIKSRSLPSSEIAKAWKQLQESQGRCGSEDNSNTKLVKISEKFHVQDLFTDVTEGKLSRQGSLRGIAHMKAVVEAFRSMENIAHTTINSYEIAESQLTDFSPSHRVQKAQTYLSEYPYLPTTDPSKYHSRVDVKASGLISLKELKAKGKRRNSVPDLSLNPKFTVNL